MEVQFFGGDDESGNVFVVETKAKAGQLLESHTHKHAHTSVLVSGVAKVIVDGKESVLEGYTTVTIPANTSHSVIAVTDIVWLCLWAGDLAPREEAEASVKLAACMCSSEPVPSNKFKKLDNVKLDVSNIYWNLLNNPQLWNQYTGRTEKEDSPHYQLDDIWARWVGPKTDMTQQQDCVWYPSADVLGIKALCLDLMRYVGGTELGGVLITRIKPGQVCKPHVDDAWHANRYQKFLVQIASAPGQEFCFEDGSFQAKPGEVVWFDNSNLHWVTNDTPYERVSMIVCIRIEKE